MNNFNGVEMLLTFMLDRVFFMSLPKQKQLAIINKQFKKNAMRFIKLLIFLVIAVAALILIGKFACPNLQHVIPEGKDVTKEEFNLTQIRLKGTQKLIVAEATGVATGEYFIDHVTQTMFGDVDLGTYGNRKVTFNGQTITLAFGYTPQHDYLSPDAYGTTEYTDKIVKIRIVSKYVSPLVIYTMPEGFAREETSWFKGGVDQQAFNQFVRNRSTEKGYEIIAGNTEDFKNYVQQFAMWECLRIVQKEHPDKDFEFEFVLDGVVINTPDNFTGNTSDYGIHQINLDTTIVEK